jgi:protein CpxP
MLELNYGFLLARRAMLLAGVLIAGCCALVAQTGEQPAPQPNGPGYGEMHRRGPEHELRQLTLVLTLTPEQQTQVKALLDARRQKMEELRNAPAANSSASETAPPANREQFKAIEQETNTKIDALLNDEQKAKFATYQQQRRQMMQRHHGGGAPDEAPAPQGA